MDKKQCTIKAECSVKGIGLHTGSEATVTLKPAGENQGIQFIRVDIEGRPLIQALPSNVCLNENVPRCTTLRSGDIAILTVEHLMSALYGLGVDNVVVEIDNEEVPGLDGSSLDFVRLIRSVGVEEQEALKKICEIKEPIGIHQNGSSIYIFPSDSFKVSYTLDYDDPCLKSQFFDINLADGTYETELAPCRTFCLESEAELLRSKGMGKGANYKNTLVVGVNGVVENEVRFSDEFARHKVLDLVGDLYLLGMPIHGHVFATKSGHDLNIRLLKKINEQYLRYQKSSAPAQLDLGDHNEIDVHGIMKILPHRYPFLFVDRVVEIEKGRKAVGIKNVTINDQFFRGHFPTRPVMPGVLMVEAMAQTAGVVILTNEAHRGKVAFFMSVDKVKFRKVVAPGDQLLMEVEVLKDKARFAQVRGIARVNEGVVAEADMMFSFTDASYLDE